MTSLRSKWVLAAGAVAAAAVGATVVGQSGCASDCASDCPPATVYIGNLDGQQLAIDEIRVDGPACPSSSGVYCIGDGPGTNCTHFTVTGTTEGVCDVLIVFHDRPAMIVRTEFGPPIQKGCCKGHTIVGDAVFVIPANADAGITGLDGGTDAVTIVTDAGIDGGAGN